MIVIMSKNLIERLYSLPGHELKFAAGVPVFHLGDEVRQVHLVRAGTIHLVRNQADGSALILQRAGLGAILAEASVYSSSYHCDARAESAATTWAIEKSEMRRRLSKSPEFAEAWSLHLAHEVQRARLQAEILSLKTVEARLNAWMVWNETLPAKGQWSNVACEIGVSPEALYREIARRQHS